MLINGKETELVMDFGAAKIVKAKTGKSFFALKADDFENDEVMGAVLYAMAKRGNPDITEEDIEYLNLVEMGKALQLVTAGIKEFNPEPLPNVETTAAGPAEESESKN